MVLVSFIVVPLRPILIIRTAVRHLNVLTKPTWHLCSDNRSSFFRGKYRFNIKKFCGMISEKDCKEKRLVIESYLRLLEESEAYAKKPTAVKKVFGWLAPTFNSACGEGSLITFAYTNRKSGDIKLYAMHDEQLMDLLYFIYAFLYGLEGSMEDLLYITAVTQLMKDYGNDDLKLDELEISYLVKGYYERKTTLDYDLSHLNLTENFNPAGLKADMYEMRMRGINLAQLVAEVCLVFLEREEKAA